MRLGLTSRILLFFTLLLSALLLLVGAFAYRSGTRSLTDAAISEMLTKAIEKDAALNSWIDQQMADFGQIAGELALADKAAELGAATPDSAQARAAHATLQRQLQTYVGSAHAVFVELFVMEPEGGRVLASSSPREEGKFKTGHPYFDHGKTDRYLQGPYQSVDMQAPGMTVAAPLRAADGRVVAVLAARFNLAIVNAIVQRRTGLYRTEDAFLVNAERYPVTQPRLLDEPVVLRRKFDTVGVRRCAARNSGVVLAADYRGVPSIAVCRWNSQLELGLIVKIDQAEALAPAAAFGRAVTLISSIALLAGLGLTLLLARSITRPLLALHDRVRRAGGVAVPWLESPGDEVALLAREFDRTAAHLVERSAELAKANDALQAENLGRRQIEESLRASQQIIEGILDAIPARVFWKDRNLVYLGCSTAFARDAGFTDPKELIGKDDYQMGWRAQADAYRSDDRAVIDSGCAKILIEEPQTTPDGQTITLLTSKIPLRDASGAISGVLGMYIDVSERKRAEEALRQLNGELETLIKSHEVAAAVIENASEGVIVADAKLQIESVNPAFERITGYPAAEVVGRSPKILSSGRHDAAFFYRLKELVDAAGQWRGEIWNRRRDGVIYPQQTSVNVLRDAAGHISHYATVFSDNTARNELEARLREMSSVDGLTGIANRRRFDEVLAQEWARALREGGVLSLLMADIDNFKAYNDRYGHLEGDRCLQQVAQAIKTAANRAGDLAARYGGEEFAVILPGVDAAAALRMAEKVRAAVAALALPHADSDAAAVVTISLGVATALPHQAVRQVELIGDADRALYQAKHAGRNRVVAAATAELRPVPAWERSPPSASQAEA